MNMMNGDGCGENNTSISCVILYTSKVKQFINASGGGIGGGLESFPDLFAPVPCPKGVGLAVMCGLRVCRMYITRKLGLWHRISR